MRKKRWVLIGVTLLAVWAAITYWQVLEHRRMKQSLRQTLLNRAGDISASLGVVIRSQRRAGAVVPRPRLEGALRELVKSSELVSIALMNPFGEVVASAGTNLPCTREDLDAGGGVLWNEGNVVVADLVELGGLQGPPPEEEDIPFRPEPRPGILLVDPPERAPGRSPEDNADENPDDSSETEKKNPTSNDPDSAEEIGLTDEGSGGDSRESGRMRGSGQGSNDRDTEPELGFRRRRRPPFWTRSRFSPSMSQEEFQELFKKQGLQEIVLVMSALSIDQEMIRDFWLRFTIVAVALLAGIGLAWAWWSVEHSADLQMRLAGTRAMNSYLRELSVAAAGLAHETRNPLNIVRGATQMIARETAESSQLHEKTDTVLEEVDRITTRLNEFIDYAKPREPKITPANVKEVVRDVVRTLESDKTEKEIDFAILDSDLNIQADESLLRQVFFNLLFNAFEAVEQGGRVEVITSKQKSGGIILDIRDNGPGIPENARDEIFKPYFTLDEEGTGLGLAIVRQIVLAHGWQISYIAGDDRGSIFRITGVKVSRKA